MSGPDAGGKNLVTGGLKLIAQGITLALDELGELGMVGEAGSGRGFSDLALTGLELGHDGLTSALDSFCERWEWGVRTLVGEGNAFAEAVGLSAGTYHETEQYIEGSFKVVTNSLVGNPYAVEDDVTKMNWGELADHNAYADPDYSAESFQNAWDNSKQGWQDAGRDVMTSHTVGPMGLNPENLHGAFGVSDGEYEQMLDDRFGPSAEERARKTQGGDTG
ncbi:hypothetical protein [Streptomyces avermitilis]|uniref:hypothetical protein n=1 Tax=Streptomyces avermitilis TaxID=33903 RepID=UPI0037F84B1F